MWDPVLEAFRRAAGDREHGAGEIELRLLSELLSLRGELTPDALARGAAELLAGQPAMANLRSLARRVKAGRGVGWLEARRGALESLPDRLTEHGWPLLDRTELVLSISRSSTVAAVLAGARSRGWDGGVVVFDGSPAGGGRAQAEGLEAAGHRVSSLPDAAMRAVLEDGRDGLVVVGADAVSARRMVNACGTGALLELAAARGLARVVVADLGKDLDDAELDAMVAAGGLADEPGPRRRWAAFESLPLALASHRLCEDGLFAVATPDR